MLGVYSKQAVQLQGTNLWKYLNEINPNYASRAITFLEGINPILDSIVRFFPYYTRHDAIHGVAVIRRIVQILEPQCLDYESQIALSAEEAFLLITSAYAHDLGMAVFPGEEEDLRNRLNIYDDTDWQTSERLSKYLRDNHSIRGLTYIQRNAEILCIPQNLVSILGDMMRAHNLSIHRMEVELNKRVAAGEQEINLKQLSCILCIADALEFSDTRVIDGVIEDLKNQTNADKRISYRENMKHVSIGDSVAIGEDGRVIFNGTFNDADVLALAHRTIDLTEEWVRQYCYIENGSSKKRLRVNADTFIRNLEFPGVDFERLGIRIKKENIINLITSNATWSNDVSVPIRELLQNSVEACRYREYHTPKEKKYSPKIKVLFDRAKESITVSDNGCGMSKTVILNNFLTVGNSRADDSTYISHGYNSLSRFGIGFWSMFTIASNVTVETAPFEKLGFHDDLDSVIEGSSFEVNIEQFKDYTVFVPVSRTTGTTITLKLKSEIEMDQILSRLLNQINCSPIPIEIEVIGERVISIPLNPVPFDFGKLFGARINLARENNVEIFQWTGSKDNIEVALTIAYRKENGKITFLMKDGHKSLLQIIPRLQQPMVSVCGFSVPLSIGKLCWDLGRVGHVTVNVSNPKGIKYRLDRRTLLPSTEQEEATFTSNQLMHEGYRCFLKSNNCYNPQDIYNLNQQSKMHGGNVFDQYTENALFVASKNYPDLSIFKLIEVNKGIGYEEAKISFVSLDDILQMTNYRLFVCQNYQLEANYHVEASNIYPIVYDYLASNVVIEDQKSTYILESNIEASMLFDNTENSRLIDQVIPTNLGELKLYIIDMTKNLDLENHPWVLTKVQGPWSGTIYETRIISSNQQNFILLGRYRLVVQKDSYLSKIIKQLANEGKMYEIAEIASKLQEAHEGYIDPELLNSWPGLLD